MVHTDFSFNSTYYPQLDGLTYAVKQSLGSMLHSLVCASLKKWDQLLFQAEFALSHLLIIIHCLVLFRLFMVLILIFAIDLVPVPHLKHPNIEAGELVQWKRDM